MTIFFTSDTHFFHKRVIEYSNRPFRDVFDMNSQLIVNWNNVVKPNDVIYHLGDFGFAHTEKLEQVLRQLNGKKHLILGNHDKQMTKGNIPSYFEEITRYKEIYVRNKVCVVLCHYPFGSWNKAHYGSFCLHGHSHGRYKAIGKIHDVGVDVNNYTPVSYDEIERIMSKKDLFCADHVVGEDEE